MPNVKPGDLCLVVGTSATPFLNGRVVEVVGLARHLQRFESENGKTYYFDAESALGGLSWEVKSSTTLPWKLLSGETKQMKSRPIGDAFLIKIKDGDLTLDEETEIINNTSKTKEKETQC